MQHTLDRITTFSKRFNIKLNNNSHIKPNNTSSFHSSISSIGYDKVALCSICIILLAISTIFLCPPIFTDDDNTNAITGTSIASDTTLSISLSTTSLSLDLTPTSSNGTFASTADDDTKASTAVIHVATNNITGYTLGIKASNPVSSSADKLISNNEKCENTPTSNKCAISSLSQPVSSEDYIDNTVEGIDLNNTWGYAPSHYNSTPNTTTTTTLDPNTNENITTTSLINYYPAPVHGDTIATTTGPNPEDTNNTNNNGGGELLEDEYTIDYGMRIDYTPYTGTYSTNYNNQSYIITAVGNPVPYSVSYNANKPEQAPSEITVDNLPNAQVGTVSSGDTVAVLLSQKVPTIGTTNPTTGDYEYAGYVFNGWCTVQPQVPNEINGQPNTQGYQVCPVDQQQLDQARLFQPGDNFGIDQTAENTQILYATWGAPARVTYNSNGLIYNNTPGDTTNIVEYIPTYEGNKITGQRQNIVYTGTYSTPAYEETTPTTNYIMKGWSTDQNATEATYTDEQTIINDLTLNTNDSITLYAIWTYTTVITFNGNGNDGGEDMHTITVEAGQTINLPQNAYTKTNYYFAGWSTADDGNGEYYKNKSNYTASVGSNNITLYAQWTDCPPNNICYDDSGANSPITMSNQTSNYKDNSNPVTSNMEVNLWPMNYKYDTNNDGYNDYGFAGWSEDKNAASKMLDSNPDNDPAVYGPNQTITLGDMSAAGLKLYAVWMPVAKDSNNAELAFQTANLLTTTLADGTTLASKPVKYVTALRDYRDNQVYAVAKLADENYWMIENLRLNSTATITTDNTNNPLIADGNVAITNNDGNAYNHLSPANSSWCTDFNLECFDQSYLNTDNTTNTSINMAGPYERDNIYSFGNYYNWYSATAGNGKYRTTNGTTVQGDICPAGWNLPAGHAEKNGPYADLDIAMGGTGIARYTPEASNSWRSFPSNFLYSGYWRGLSTLERGDYGHYWSSTAWENYVAITLHLTSTSVAPGDSYNGKYSGLPVRCIKK